MPQASTSPRRPNWPSKVAGLRTNTASIIALGFGTIALTFGGFGIWSATVPIASAVVANGQVVVASKRKEIQHPTGGVIRALHVVDGIRVKAGASLVELDDADALDRYTRTRDSFFLALAAEARLQAEVQDADAPSFSAELLNAARETSVVQGIVDGQAGLFKVRRAELFGQLSIVREQHQQLKHELQGLQAERRAAEVQIGLTHKELSVVEDLFEKGYTTRTRVFGLKREAAQLAGSSERLAASSARTRSALIENELKLLQVENQIRTTVQTELRDVQAKLSTLREQYHAAKQAHERMTIRAPVSGVIMALRLNTVGAVVRPGETVLEIVPDADRLMVEVQLPPSDVDSVKVGLETEVRLTGMPQRTVPALHGRVALVSADALHDGRTNATYFVAHVDISDSEMRRLGNNQLQPGMPAAVMIKTGERTALAYLTQPLTESVTRAWREP